MTAPESVLCPLTGLPFGSSRAEALEYAMHPLEEAEGYAALHAVGARVSPGSGWNARGHGGVARGDQAGTANEGGVSGALLEPRKYRWLTEGQQYTYSPKPGKGNDSKRGQTCVVITVPRAGAKPANALVRFDDGYEAVVPSGVLKAVLNVT